MGARLPRLRSVQGVETKVRSWTSAAVPVLLRVVSWDAPRPVSDRPPVAREAGALAAFVDRPASCRLRRRWRDSIRKWKSPLQLRSTWAKAGFSTRFSWISTAPASCRSNRRSRNSPRMAQGGQLWRVVLRDAGHRLRAQHCRLPPATRRRTGRARWRPSPPRTRSLHGSVPARGRALLRWVFSWSGLLSTCGTAHRGQAGRCRHSSHVISVLVLGLSAVSPVVGTLTRHRRAVRAAQARAP